MPMLTTLRMRLPVWPRQRAAADLVGERGHPVEHRVHLGHDVDAVDHDPLASRRAQRDVQHGALLGHIDLSPRNIASMRSRRPHSSARRTSSRSVSSVMRFFE